MTRHAAVDAVSELIRPHRMIVHVTPSVSYLVHAPCLLRQLAQCVAVGGEQGGRGVPGSRAPLNADALDLWYEVAMTVHGWAQELRLPSVAYDPAHPIPRAGRMLRAVASSTAPDEFLVGVEHRVRDWTRRITAMVTGTPEQRGIRGACPECGATMVAEDREGEGRVQVYAVVLVVRTVDERPLRWLACRACGWSLGLGEHAEGLEMVNGA